MYTNPFETQLTAENGAKRGIHSLVSKLTRHRGRNFEILIIHTYKFN